jgi:hypothetical protein
VRHAQLHNIYFVIAFYIYVAATDQEQPSLTALQAQILDQNMEEIGWGEDARTTPPVDAGSRRRDGNSRVQQLQAARAP